MRKFIVRFDAASGTTYELVLRYNGIFVGEGFRNHDRPPEHIAELPSGNISVGHMEYVSLNEFASEYGCVIESFDSDAGN